MTGLKAHIPAAQALECSNYKPERLDLNIKLQIFFTIHNISRNCVERKVKRVARLGLPLTGYLSQCPEKQTRNHFHHQTCSIWRWSIWSTSLPLPVLHNSLRYLPSRKCHLVLRFVNATIIRNDNVSVSSEKNSRKRVSKKRPAPMIKDTADLAEVHAVRNGL